MLLPRAEPASPHRLLPSSRPCQDAGGVAEGRGAPGADPGREGVPAGAEVGSGFEPRDWLDGGCGEAGAEDGAGADGLAGSEDWCGALGGEDGEDGGLGADGEDGFDEDFGGSDDDFGGGFEDDLDGGFDGGEDGEAVDDDPDGEDDGDFDADDGDGVQGVPFPVGHGVAGGVVVGRETFPLGVGGLSGGRVQWSLLTVSPL